MDGSASPRKPSVRMSRRSSPLSLEVACRSTESTRSAGSMPTPSSVTRMSDTPPPEVTTSISRAPASMAFSTSSLTTLAGRSITSPAAIRLTVSGGSCRMATGPLPWRCAGSGALLQPLARQNLAQLDGRLVERIDAEQTAGEDRLQHEMHEQGAQRALVQPVDVDHAHR